MTIETLAAVFVFAAAFILGGKFHKPGITTGRSFLSFSAGAAVAYIFIHLRPELEIARHVFMEERSGPFAAYGIHVATMIGFVVFYGLEQFGIGSRKIADGREIAEARQSHMSFGINIGVFSLYAFLIGLLLVDNLERTTVPILFYTIAMSLHFLTLGHSLHKEYGPLYDRVGAPILVVSTFAGWGIAMCMDIPKLIIAVLLGVVAGGVIVNTIITELPTEKEGRFFPFLLGSVSYTVILLLSV